MMKTIGEKLNDWSATGSSLYRAFERGLLYQRLRRHKGPILVGPYRGEVGFEVLYWIPWLRFLMKQYDIPPERVIPISRAGASCWYGCPTGVEIYSMRTPQDLRIVSRMNEQKFGLLKQITYDAFDRSVIADVRREVGLKDALLIHPRHMYAHLAPFWHADKGFSWLLQSTRYQMPLPVIPLEQLKQPLPEKFVAVRFYARSTFPPVPQTTMLAQATVQRLAQHVPVVLLNNGLHEDEHQDLLISGANITTIRDYVDITPSDNLALVSAVLARSIGFVGTYGGLAQLALCLGKPSVSFFADWTGTAAAHWHLSVELGLRTGVAFLVLRLNEVPLLSSVLPFVKVEEPAVA